MDQRRDNEVFPVVVVGAGPVGLIAALAVRHEGLPVVVVEREAEGRPRAGSRATFLFRESLDFLEQIAPGVTRDLIEQSRQWTAIRTTFRGRDVYAKTFPPSKPGAFGISLPQPDQEKVLLERCIDEGVEFIWGDGVGDATSDPKGVTLTLESGTKVRTEYVIAADGAGSAVRASLGDMDLDGDRSRTGFIIVDAAAMDPEAPILKERAFHYEHPAVGGRNVLLVPFGGGLRIDLQCKPDDDIAEWKTEPKLSVWIAAVAGQSYADNQLWVSTYRFNRSVAASYTDAHRRVLLTGEAAHLFPPFGGGRGLNSGVPDAVFAAQAIAQALACADPVEARRFVEAVAQERRMAGQLNRDAASTALVRMEAASPWRRAQRLLAARLARWIPRCGEWLDRGPTAGSTDPVTTRSRF